MSVSTKIEEYVMHLDGMERCPECRFVWNDTGEGHYYHCRYYIVEDHEDLVAEETVTKFNASALSRRSRRKEACTSV